MRESVYNQFKRQIELVAKIKVQVPVAVPVPISFVTRCHMRLPVPIGHIPRAGLFESRLTRT